ncbi:hypothetical protein BSP36_176 [Bacillus phage BSP36]|nr:hypothetical protein BSP36_176 [Bacillus phage BSP36]
MLDVITQLFFTTVGWFIGHFLISKPLIRWLERRDEQKRKESMIQRRGEI